MVGFLRIRRDDDRILGIEPGKAADVGNAKAGEGQSPCDHHQPSDRHLRRKPAHLAHVLLFMQGVFHRARAQEQQRLEEGVAEEVEDAHRKGAKAARREHVAKLRAGRIRDDAFDVVLADGDGRGKEGCERTDEGDEAECNGCLLKERGKPRHHKHAGRHHGGRMDQGGNRSWALHRVRKPGVQQELRRLAHRAHKQEQAQRGQNVDLIAEEQERLPGHRGGRTEKRIHVDGSEDGKEAKYAQRKAEVADAIDDERLDGSRVRRFLLIPEANEQVREQTHALPAKEHLQQVVGRHQHQHGEREAGQIGEEARARWVLGHVADRIDMYERRDRRDDHEHDSG